MAVPLPCQLPHDDRSQSSTASRKYCYSRVNQHKAEATRTKHAHEHRRWYRSKKRPAISVHFPPASCLNHSVRGSPRMLRGTTTHISIKRHISFSHTHYTSHQQVDQRAVRSRAAHTQRTRTLVKRWSGSLPFNLQRCKKRVWTKHASTSRASDPRLEV